MLINRDLDFVCVESVLPVLIQISVMQLHVVDVLLADVLLANVLLADEGKTKKGEYYGSKTQCIMSIRKNMAQEL